jgi:hypothetical protein
MSVNLSTNYLGLKLRNPLVVSACHLTGEIDVLRRLEDHGAVPLERRQQPGSAAVSRSLGPSNRSAILAQVRAQKPIPSIASGGTSTKR